MKKVGFVLGVVLFLCVSHALRTLDELCTRAIWLDHGRLVDSGPVKQLISAYTESIAAPVAAT